MVVEEEEEEEFIQNRTRTGRDSYTGWDHNTHGHKANIF